MKYIAIITYRNIQVEVKVTNILISGIYELPEFLKKVRTVYKHDLQYIHQITDYSIEDCEKFENGELPIMQSYLSDFVIAYKLPKKIIKIGYAEKETNTQSFGNEYTKKFSERLLELRLNKKVTQEEAAKKIGVARTTYAGYEINRSEPDIYTLVKIANYFNTSIDYLVGRYNKTE